MRLLGFFLKFTQLKSDIQGVMSRFMLVLLCVFFFKGCSGAASRRAMYLNSSKSGDLPEAQTPVQKDTLESATESAPEPDNPEEFNYFPYDLQVDTLAYMACETNNYGTFQVGAFFSMSGLRLSEYFLKKTESLSASALEDLIKSSTKHKASPYLAVSLKNNLLQIFQPKKAFNDTLRLKDLIPDLIRSGKTRIKEYNEDPIKVEIKQPSYVLNHNSRDGFQDRLVLALYYKGGKDNAVLHKTDGVPGKDIYGRIYSLDFEDLNMVSNDDSNDRYALSAVSEKKLPTAPAQKEWTCPDSLVLEIRRHAKNAFNPQEWFIYRSQDANYRTRYRSLEQAQGAEDPTHRPPPNESVCENSDQGGVALKVVRAVLGNDWNINMGTKCISPRNSSKPCYHMSTQRNVQDRLDTNRDSCNNNNIKYCPRFLSICVRKN